MQTERSRSARWWSRASRNLLGAWGASRCVLSDRIESVAPSGTVAVGDRVKQKKAAGEDVIDLSVGQPDFPSPPEAVRAAEQALADGETGYGPSRGLPALREAVAERHRTRRSTPCEAENVLVTPAKHALLTAFLCTVDPGDEVVLPSPSWVSYAPQVKLCGGRPVHVETDDGHVDPDDVHAAVTDDTRAIMLNAPSNPTGAVQPPSTVEALREIARDEDLWLVSDEVYGDLTHGDVDHVSPAADPGDLSNLAIVDGVSKAYSMTGWRVGWLVGPTELVEAAVKVQQHSVTHPTTFAQHGARAALEGADASLKRMQDAFQRRSHLVADRLDELGAEYPPLEGAFYAFPRFPGVDDGHELAHHLLEEAGVGVTPGEPFGPGGEGHVRISYAADEDDLAEALDRIESTVEA